MKIDTHCLLKAIRFMFLPTLSFFILLYLYFFDFQKFVSFVTEKSFFSGLIRILLFLVEIYLVRIMYEKYKNKEEMKSFFEKEDIFSNYKSEEMSISRVTSLICNLNLGCFPTVYTKNDGKEIYIIQNNKEI